LLREIIGGTDSIGLLIYTLWFIVPSLKTAYNAVIPTVNATSPTMMAVLTISNSWFTMLPLFVGFLGVMTTWIYLSRREGSDY